MFLKQEVHLTLSGNLTVNDLELKSYGKGVQKSAKKLRELNLIHQSVGKQHRESWISAFKWHPKMLSSFCGFRDMIRFMPKNDEIRKYWPFLHPTKPKKMLT